MEERKSVETIMYEQLMQLRDLSASKDVENEPELLIKISLAMVEIAKSYLF